MPELKPCPFCGGDAMVGHLYYQSYVTCAGCWAQTPSYDDRETAIHEWNRRVGEGDGDE